MLVRKKILVNSIRKNFFSSVTDGFITLILIAIFIWIFSTVMHWLLNKADWNVVSENLRLFSYGSYPLEEQWRPKIWIVSLITLTLITLSGRRIHSPRKLIPSLWISMVPLGIVLLSGGFGLRPVSTINWGGLVLTIVLTVCSGSIALPMGILLAIGRQSNLPLIQQSCKIYIDIMRSIPLIAILFFGQLMIPLFLPADIDINRVIRAIFAFAIFSSAYIAEDIRGGLQSIPLTQKEAASALGLNQLQIIYLITLPQALRAALPALTNQAIGLLQNTSLMAILGLVELLGISRSLLANPQYIGRYLEVYAWLAAIYWLVCTAMALLSKHIEFNLSPSSANYE